MEWSGVVSGLTGTPMNVLPPIKDTSGLFGYCDPSIFGAAIPITAMVIIIHCHLVLWNSKRACTFLFLDEEHY